MFKMKIFKNKYSILLLVIIAILIFLLSFQNYNYKNDIGWYDAITLTMLENELESIIKTAEENKLTQKIYLEKKHVFKKINTLIDASPNIGFMSNKIDNIINIEDNKSAVKRLNEFKNLQQKLEAILREQENSINIYNYFRNRKNREQFMTN